jgi:hypothetical protein
LWGRWRLCLRQGEQQHEGRDGGGDRPSQATS